MTNDRISGGNPFRAILDVSAALVSSLDLETVFSNVARAVGEAMMVWAVDAQSYDPATQVLTHRSCWCSEGLTEADRARLGESTSLAARPGMADVVLRRMLVEQRADDSSLNAADRRFLADRGVKTSLYAPLAVGDEVLGALGLIERRFVRRFTSIERDLFRQLCDLAAVGIHNARLYATVDRQKRQLGSMLECSRAVSSVTELDELLDTLAMRATIALDIPQSDIYEYDAATDTMTWRATWPPEEDEEGKDALGAVYLLDEYPGDPVTIREKRVLIETVSDPDLHPNTRQALAEWGEKTVINLPLLFGDRALGTLELIENRHERVLSEEEIDLAVALSEQAAVAIHAAQTPQRQERHMRRLQTLLDINRALASSHDPAEIFDVIVRESARAFDCPRAIIYDFDPAADTITPRAFFQRDSVPGYDNTGEAEPVGEVPQNREIVHSDHPVIEQVSDPALDPDSRRDMNEWGETTCLNAPLRFQGEPMGILMLLWTDEERRFTRDELDFAMGLGEQAAIALRNARLARQAQTA